MQSEVVAQRVGSGLQILLRRLASLASGLAVLAIAIGAATFATGWWIFDRSHVTWAVVGGALCAIPAMAAIAAWAFVRATASFAPRLVDDIAAFVRTPSTGAQVLIDYDSGQTIVSSAKSFSGVRDDVRDRRRDLPALYVGVRAITLVPSLAAVAVVGMILVGGLGTILLIGGLID